MSIFLSEKYRSLKAYVPGEQPRDRKYLKLNTNESPFPPSPAVSKAVAECVGDLNLYPDPEYLSLRSALAEFHGVTSDMVTVGAGSDEILDWCFRAFFTDRGAAFPDVTYGFYKVWADLYSIPYETFPLMDDFSIDPADYENTSRAVVIPDPNAPTGVRLGSAAVERILRADPGRVVVIDEAYADFASGDCVPLTKKYDNLVVVRTFSKSRSLAGGRAGYCIASPELIRDIDLLRFSSKPYNLSRMTAAAAEAALSDNGYFEENVKKICDTREITKEALRNAGFEVTDSEANFLFVRKAGVSGAAIESELRRRGVLVRRFDGPRTGDFLRVTVGEASDMKRFVSEIASAAKTVAETGNLV